MGWRDERIRVIRVAGASYRSEALRDESFAPGRRLALVPEPENEHDPNALGIWNEARTLQAGYVPAETAPETPRDWQAVSLWEFTGADGGRIGLRVLLAPPEKHARWSGVNPSSDQALASSGCSASSSSSRATRPNAAASKTVSRPAVSSDSPRSRSPA